MLNPAPVTLCWMHAAAGSTISEPAVYGLARCRDHRIEGFRRYLTAAFATGRLRPGVAIRFIRVPPCSPRGFRGKTTLRGISLLSEPSMVSMRDGIRCGENRWAASTWVADPTSAGLRKWSSFTCCLIGCGVVPSSQRESLDSVGRLCGLLGCTPS